MGERAATLRAYLKARRTFLLLPIAGVAAGCVIAEIALRIAGISYPSFTVPDDVLSWMHRPGSSGWYTGEGRAFIRINRDGWRDTEHSKTKPDAAFRIAIIGDSYAEALQLPLEETFWSTMRRKLSACGSFAGQEIEVLNFGVSSYGTAQNYSCCVTTYGSTSRISWCLRFSRPMTFVRIHDPFKAIQPDRISYSTAMTWYSMIRSWRPTRTGRAIRFDRDHCIGLLNIHESCNSRDRSGRESHHRRPSLEGAARQISALSCSRSLRMRSGKKPGASPSA